MPPRIKFPGDPTIRDTGVPGSAPNNPLSPNVVATSVEMLDPEEQEQEPKNFRRPVGKHPDANDDFDEDPDEIDEEAPIYERESIGARIGKPLEEAQAIEEVARELDHDDVVPLIFNKPVNLQDKGLMHHWGPGVHLVPVSLAGDKKAGIPMHFWLRAHKVRRAGKRQPNPAREMAEADED